MKNTNLESTCRIRGMRTHSNVIMTQNRAFQNQNPVATCRSELKNISITMPFLVIFIGIIYK